MQRGRDKWGENGNGCGEWWEMEWQWQKPPATDQKHANKQNTVCVFRKLHRYRIERILCIFNNVNASQ